MSEVKKVVNTFFRGVLHRVFPTTAQLPLPALLQLVPASGPATSRVHQNQPRLKVFELEIEAHVILLEVEHAQQFMLCDNPRLLRVGLGQDTECTGRCSLQQCKRGA